MREVELVPHPYLRVGLVEAAARVHPSDDALQNLLRADVEAPAGVAPADRELTRGAIRQLLRFCGYKPSGRGKPASEYLAQAATRDEGLRSINNVVDVNNVVSLHSGLPISVFDADRLAGPLRIAPGEPGEHYVFNASGQQIDLAGLLTVFAQRDGQWHPAGNAVKDSMGTKVHDASTRVLAVIYASKELPHEHARAAVDWYAALLAAHCDGQDVETALLDAASP